MMRLFTPAFFTMPTATASDGLTTAPTAIAIGSGIAGTIRWITQPTDIAVSTTSTTASRKIELKFRRKSCTGMRIAVANSSGGRINSRMISGSMTTSGTCGTNATAALRTSRSTGATTPMRSPNGSASAMTASMITMSKMMNVTVTNFSGAHENRPAPP